MEEKGNIQINLNDQKKDDIIKKKSLTQKFMKKMKKKSYLKHIQELISPRNQDANIILQE